MTISTTLIRVSFWLKGARCWRTFPPPVASTFVDVTQCAQLGSGGADGTTRFSQDFVAPVNCGPLAHCEHPQYR